jgi:anionic cell wall polymer biosynthesis LytR-Cps2A-Psr (LCP) family protein
MKDIGRINDAIGGVTVTIDTDMTNVDPAFKKGSTVTLTGDQAEKFLRARMQLKDDTNEARMDRQQQYLDAAYVKIISETRERPEYIAELYTQLEDIIQTNTNEREVSVIANHLIQYEDCGFNRFDGETKMNDTQGDDVEHEEFYVDNNSILENLKKVIDLRVDTESDDEEDDEEE